MNVLHLFPWTLATAAFAYGRTSARRPGTAGRSAPPPLKRGKFVTLLGYEVIESPNNLNFSRGYLFGLAIPLTHTGGLASYTFTDWFNVTAGVVLG